MSAADLLWVTSYYDGPLCGLCTYKGQVHWFAAEGEDPEPAVWGVYTLTEKELAAALTDKAAFEELVSTRWSYDLPRSKRAVRPQETHARYYDTAKRPRAATFVRPERRVTAVTSLRDPREHG